MADDKAKVGIIIEAKADETQVKQEADRIAEITQKQLDKDELLIEAKFNQVRLEQNLEKARIQLREFKKKWDEEAEIRARMDIQDLTEKLNKTKSWIKDLENEIEDLEKQKTTWVANEVEKIWESATKSSSAINDLLWNLWKFLAIWTLIKKYVSMFNEFQQSQKKIIQETGASWEKLKQLTDDMVAVSWKVNQSQNEIAESIWELNTRLGVSWQELQGITEDYLKFATVTGQDWKEAIADNVRMFNQWWVSTEKQAEYLDKLAKAWQDTWINVWTLTNNLQENSATLREMWFSLDDSIALLSNFEKNWIEASETLQAMKRGISSLVDEWKSPNEAFDELVESIKNAKTSTEAMNIAFENFWNRWWLAIYNAIRQGNFSLEDMKKSLDNANWTVEETWKNMETFWEFLERKWNWIMTDFAEWNNEWFQATRQLAEWLSDLLKPAIDLVQEAFENLKTTFEWYIWVVWEVLRWERELNWELTKKGQFMVQVREQTKKINEVESQYADTSERLNKSLKDFDNTQIDDSATQEQFELSKTKALEAAKAFAIALQAKQQYAFSVSQEAYTMYKNWDISWKQAKTIIENNKKLINDLEVQKNNLIKTVDEINKIQYDPKKNKWWWSWNNNNKWWKWSKNVKSKKEELEEMRNLEIQAIYDSELSQEEKYKKYLEIYDNYKQAIIDAEWKTYDSLQKEADEYFKKQEQAIKEEIKYYEDVEKVQDKVDEAIDKHWKNIEKLWDEWTKVKNKAKDSLREVKQSIKELDEDYEKDIISLYNETKQKVLEWKKDSNLAYIWERVSLKDLMDWQYPTINWVDIDKAIEYKKQVLDLAEFEKTLTDEQKKQAEQEEKLTKLWELRLQHEKERATLVEKSKVYEAVANSWDFLENAKVRYKDESKEVIQYFDDEKQQWTDITDFKNSEYARDVLDNQLALQQKKQDLDTELKDELKAYGDQVMKLRDEYKNDTKNYKDELENKKQALRDYVREANEILAWLSSKAPHNAYWGSILNWNASWVWENGPEQIIARQSSYVQPRNAVNNNSTVYNNQSSLNINGLEIGNFNTIDDLLNELRNRLTYRN